MAAGLGVVPVAMEDGPRKKPHDTLPRQSGVKCSRAWRSPGWLPCSALLCAAMQQPRKRKKEKERRKRKKKEEERRKK